ncbi:cation transport protein [Lactiplantibacillus plantarum]|nr:cation transport protein [Lactiplantibacillus plantarum]
MISSLMFIWLRSTLPQFASYLSSFQTDPSVRKVIFLKAHYDGNLIMLRATIVVPPRMTAIEITRLIETINQIMWQEFGVMETDVIITTSY